MNSTIKPANVEMSDSMIVIQIRTNTRDFIQFQTIHAPTAGFKRAPHDQGLALLSKDTGEPIALINANRFLHEIGELVHVEVRTDPAKAPMEYQAGTRLMDACARLAKETGGALFDSRGKPLSEAEQAAIALHIDTVMSERQSMEFRQIKEAGEKLPNGNRLTREDDISFITTIRTNRGKYLSTNYFDAPIEPYFEGKITGYRMAHEVLSFIAAHKVKHFPLQHVMEAVYSITAKDVPNTVRFNTPGVSGAADAFAHAMEEMIRYAGRHCDHLRWLSSMVEYEQQNNARYDELRLSQKAEFVERMKEAREKKRRQQAVGARLVKASATKARKEAVAA
jgi:hypothetical protein